MSDTPRTDALANAYSLHALDFFGLARELERENAELRAEILDLKEDWARNECYIDRNPSTYEGVVEVNVTDSGAISSRASLLRDLAEAGRFRITRECGRMVVGYWPEHDPLKKEVQP